MTAGHILVAATVVAVFLFVVGLVDLLEAVPK